MTDRDRLIELLEDFDRTYDCFRVRCEQIADHLLANGVIVPPCKIDDTLYYPWLYDGTSGIAILEVSCIKIYVQGRCLVFYTDVESDMPMPNCFTIEDFGKTVFLTKEEAETELKKKRGKENEC